MEDPGSPGDTITVLGRGVQQGDTDFETPISFNGAVDAGFTRATRFNSGSNSKDHGLQNTLAEQRETQAREVKELREQQEQAQKKAAEVGGGSSKSY
ncbi:hypothetical protein LTR66_012547 [Elasticomyces elasticus]|nr:hypothetical protein LTR66_012547 [Elasticomyces elasticus]